MYKCISCATRFLPSSWVSDPICSFCLKQDELQEEEDICTEVHSLLNPEGVTQAIFYD